MLNDCTDLSCLVLKSSIVVRGDLGISVLIWGKGELRLAK